MTFHWLRRQPRGRLAEMYQHSVYIRSWKGRGRVWDLWKFSYLISGQSLKARTYWIPFLYCSLWHEEKSCILEEIECEEHNRLAIINENIEVSKMLAKKRCAEISCSLFQRSRAFVVNCNIKYESQFGMFDVLTVFPGRKINGFICFRIIVLSIHMNLDVPELSIQSLCYAWWPLW